MVPFDTGHAARRFAPPALDRQEAVAIRAKRPARPGGRGEARIGVPRMHGQAVRVGVVRRALLRRRGRGREPRLRREFEALARRHRQVSAPVEQGQRQRHGRQPEGHRGDVGMRGAVPLFGGGRLGGGAFGPVRLLLVPIRRLPRFARERHTDDGCFHRMYMPPLTSNSAPVANAPASEHRNATSAAISSGSPRRPAGICGRIFVSSTSFGTDSSIAVAR